MTTRQQSDDRVVPEGRRKAVQSRDVERPRGGKAVTVEERLPQLELRFGTAECLEERADGGAEEGEPSSVPRAVRKPKRKDERAAVPSMGAVCSRLSEAFENVASNDGAAGPDRNSVDEVREHLGTLLPKLKTSLLEGTYAPGNIRRVWIPKAGGGQRGLGIPNVVDRVVQEAVRLVLEPLYEPTFHPSSHGFRPERSCHTAIRQARSYLEDGHEWVVDLDLEKFFDRVNHQRLMARLSERTKDREVLVLIGKMLKAKVVMPDGVVVSTDEGVPQGGPLSPLLSNIVLDELDEELEERGHLFVRYADDCNIYVRSERAGQRVMASVTRFLESRMRLKVNASKSAVARPEERHFLGFRLRREPETGEVEVLLSKRSEERLAATIRERTPRVWGSSLKACIAGLNSYLRGWMGFFGICTVTVERVLGNADAHIRRRLRAIQLRHWKRRSTIALRLTQLGAKRASAWRTVYSGKSTWALSASPPVHRALRNAHWAAQGLVSLLELWHTKHRHIGGTAQLSLALR